MFEVTVLVLACMINAMLGLIVYLKNPSSSTNKSFLTLTGSLVAWSIFNYISVHPFFFSQLIWIRLVLLNAALLCLLVFRTFLAFPDLVLPRKYTKLSRYATLFTIFVMILTLTPLVFRSLSLQNGHAEPVPAPGIGLFLLQSIGLLGLGTLAVIKKYKRAKGASRAQLRFILVGIAGTFTLIIITNFLMVVAFHNSSLVPYGPTFTLIFSAAFAYAIIRHRLFDIRMLVARALGYAGSLAALAAIYGFIVFGLANIILKLHLSVLTQIILSGAAAIAALLFDRLRSIFDKVTNRIFFQDTYNSEELFDNINRVLIATLDLNKLLQQSANLIASNLKAEYCLFGLKESDPGKYRIIGTQNRHFTLLDIKTARKITPKYPTRVIVADYMEDDTEIKELLQKNKIEVLVRLSSRTDRFEEGLGYIILGPKQSGNPYSRKDVHVLDTLAKEFILAIQNAMRVEEIKEFNSTLEYKVDEATKKLRKANEKLKNLDETKDDFISMASHQLRTPLTSIKGYLSMLMEGDAGKLNPTQKDMISQSFISSQRMVFLISDMLNVSRLKTGKFAIDPTPVNLAEIVEQEIEQLKETAASRSLELTYDKPEDFPMLMLDETKIRQVIMNFTDNAIYYTPAGGHIKVQLENKEHTIELKVIDNGIGVPNSEKPHLFSKFYRAQNARVARPDGTGLGLFMAQKVIVGQGGAILFDSHEGKGSTFGFTFAKAKLKVPSEPSQEKSLVAG